jgi:hypothetical protein
LAHAQTTLLHLGTRKDEPFVEAITDFLAAYWWALIIAAVAVGVGVHNFQKGRDHDP